MKLKKGSAAAKAYMAKIRGMKGKKKPAKPVAGYVKTVRKGSATNVLYTNSAPKKAAKPKQGTLFGTHKDTRSHNVNIRVVSGTDGMIKVRHSIYTVLDDLTKQRNKYQQAIVFSGKLGETYYTAQEKTLMRKKIAELNKKIRVIEKLAKEEEKARKILKK